MAMYLLNLMFIALELRSTTRFTKSRLVDEDRPRSHLFSTGKSFTVDGLREKLREFYREEVRTEMLPWQHSITWNRSPLLHRQLALVGLQLRISSAFSPPNAMFCFWSLLASIARLSHRSQPHS
jgi:hypothetical protein